MPDRPTDILILGTRTFAEEVADILHEIPGRRLVGFVENMDRSRCRERLEGLPIHWVEDIGSLAATCDAVCALSTTFRRQFVEQVRSYGFGFATVVHPFSRVSVRSALGDGTIVSPGVVIGSHTTLGCHVIINRGALIGHHTTIGDFCTIQPGANVAGACSIGGSTYVGMGALVLDHLTVGTGSVVAAGAVVTCDVPDRVMVMGVPARIVREDIEGK